MIDLGDGVNLIIYNHKYAGTYKGILILLPFSSQIELSEGIKTQIKTKIVQIYNNKKVGKG